MESQWTMKKNLQIQRGVEDLWIKSCAILPNGKLIFVDQGNNRLILHHQTGSFDKEVKLQYTPFDITVIKPEMYAVTFGKYRTLQIFDTTEHSLCHDIKFGKSCWGVSYCDGKLYVVVFQKGIEVLNLFGMRIRTIEVEVLIEKGCYCTVDKDRIYYTGNFWGVVNCCDLEGRPNWQFNDDILASPCTISVLTNGDIFVVGYESHNVVSISRDGKRRKVILRQSDGLNYPEAIYYDLARKCLLVANSWGGTAILYNIV
ncbi:unnamed protein product [Mytilus coruscus]|uniref:RING-type E3 ubiquitin transferase n=1 Tax=Mytilus coruscus TaxID=42192 RepID=A0A6J8E1M0_MYTCO|nr:unnamed protein product [Mytilus coruscus]